MNRGVPGILSNRLRAFAAVAALLVAGCSAMPAARSAAPAATTVEGPSVPLYTPAQRAELPGVALVVIDMQAGLMPVLDADTVFAGILAMVAAADRAGAMVAWGYLDEFGVGKGSPAHELAAPLSAGPGHVRFDRPGGDTFNGGYIVPILDGAGVGTVVIAGMSSDGCVDDSVRGALLKGYRVIVPSDAHTISCLPAADPQGLRSIIRDMNRTWAALPGVTVMPAADIDFAPRSDQGA